MNYEVRAILLWSVVFLSTVGISISPAGVSSTAAQTQQQNISISTSEGLAMKALRSLLSAETTFQNTIGKGEYGDLKNMHDAHLIDSVLATGLKDGYRFTIVIKKSTMSTQPAVDLVARPIEYGKDHRRSFYITESGVMLTSDEKDAPLISMRPFAGGNGAETATVPKSEPAESGDPDEDALSRDVATNEASIITSLRAIHAAEMKYIAKAGAGVYGMLDQIEKAGLIDKTQSAATQHGYLLEVKIIAGKTGSPATFSISAIPETYGSSGRNSFYMDQTGMVHGADNEGGPANAADPAIN